MTSAVHPSTGLTDRALRTWIAPRAAVRDEIASGSEGRLVFYAMAGSVLFTMAAMAAQMLNPSGSVAGHWQEWATTQVVAGVFFRPLALYGVAALIALACRLARGQGSYYDTRVAVFWTAFVVAPAGLLLTVLGAGATALAGAPGWVAQTGQTLGSAAWAMLLVPSLAETHGFASSRPLWLVLAGLVLAASAVAGG